MMLSSPLLGRQGNKSEILITKSEGNPNI